MYNFELLVEGVKDGCKTHPEGLNLHRTNNQDKKHFVGKGGELVETMDFDLYDKALGGPFKPIPNVRKFRVVLGKQDELYAKFGLKRKFKPQLLYETHTNSDMNVYALIQLKRLRVQAITNPKLYGRSVNMLLRYSNVFFVMGLLHVFPKGHREMPLGEVLRMGKSYKKISQLKSGNVVHSRLYIEKANGKLRPLGVPAGVGRIYLHNVANFLSLYLESRKAFSSSQHGFRTGLGTKSAGESIFNDVIGKADGVYEFDLKRCFPNIGVKTVSKALRRNEVPEGGVQKFEALNMVPVANIQDVGIRMQEANEFNKHLLRETGDIAMMDSVENPEQAHRVTGAYYTHVRDLPPKNPTSYLDRLFPEGRGRAVRKAPGGVVKNSPTEDTSNRGDRGLPQGLPTSPILTILALEEMLIKRSKFNVLMYADDGIFYGNGKAPDLKKLLPNIAEKHGIVFSLEKSGGAKLPGLPLNLKFLGLRYNDGVLSAETREGASLVFDKADFATVQSLIEILPAANKPLDSARPHLGEYKKEQLDELRSLSSGELLVRSKVGGLIQSRMYQDSGLQEAVEQSFDLEGKPKSGVSKVIRKLDGLSVFNSTSYAASDLLCMLNERKNPGRSKKSS